MSDTHEDLAVTIEKTDKYVEKILMKKPTRLYESLHFEQVHGNNSPISVFTNDIGTLTFQVEESEKLNYAGCKTYLLIDFTLETRLLDLSDDSMEMLVEYCLEDYLKSYYGDKNEL